MMQQTEKQDLFNFVQGLQKWLLVLAPIVLNKLTGLFQTNERLSQPYWELNLLYQEDPCGVLV